MPEGPEVTIIAKGLNHLLKGKQIVSWEINTKSRYHKKAPDGFPEFNNELASIDGLKVKEVSNKGKFIYWTFNNGTVLFQTLGMSGGWFHHNKGNSGIVITYLSGKQIQKLYYDDQRRFGTLKFFVDPQQAKLELEKKLRTIGPDMLNDTKFTKTEFITRMRKKTLQHKNITRVITDQKVISGIGNYLKAESLYTARINPHKEVGSITNDELGSLFKAMKSKIVGSYKVGGASIRHYSDIDDIKGTYEFNMEVYGRKKDPHGRVVIAEKIAGDSQNTYWCPDYQS
jgi:formamidopyrimidine-DNA glycosylase